MLKGGNRKTELSQDMVQRLDALEDENSNPYAAKPRSKINTYELFNEADYEVGEDDRFMAEALKEEKRSIGRSKGASGAKVLKVLLIVAGSIALLGLLVYGLLNIQDIIIV